jgi:UDP-N-acetylglucosamine 2-epimerase (non-hydrolysing)
LDISEYKKIVFPIHPRTAQNLEKYDLLKFLNHNIIATKPLGYIDFIALIKNSAFVLTDSGGIQEETTFLGVPCITLRNSTERPVTVEIGTNVLSGEDITMAFKYVMEILNGSFKNGKIPELWDGKAGERIVKILIEKLFE